MPDVLLEEGSLRDGLQAEKKIVPTQDKLKLFTLMEEAGIRRIQAGSFVHPDIMPQMADSDECIQTLVPQTNTTLSALALNPRGLERALGCGVRHLTLSLSASNGHSLRNVGKPVNNALETILPLIDKAVSHGLTIRGGIQCAFGCDDEGPIDEQFLLSIIEKLIAAGATEINLADTAGTATPYMLKELIYTILDTFNALPLSLHLHNTRGLGLVNMLAGYEAGVRIFDTCAGGLGGCPFVGGAAGNVATEDAVHLFDSIGVTTGIEAQKMCKVIKKYEQLLGRQLPGYMCRVLAAQNDAPPRSVLDTAR